MSRKTELIALLAVDGLTLFTANMLYYLARFEWNWFGVYRQVPGSFLTLSLFLCAFWLGCLAFFGLYQERYAASRFDEIVSLIKAITVGILILFFVLFFDVLEAGAAKVNLLFYWIALFSLLALGRVGLRSMQKLLILKGKGLHRALIVGWSDQVEQLHRDVARYPEAGLEIVGAIRMQSSGDGMISTAVGHQIEALPDLIDDLEVQDVLIALGPNDHAQLGEVLKLCDGKAVSLKLVPDFYAVVGGMARTEHIYGLPLIEVMPEPMPAWEQNVKRLLDVVASVVILVGGLPVWAVLALAIRLTSPGPIIYRQRRVGRLGHEFTILKFRTMYENAEAATGPVWAQENDPRYTPIGRRLRQSRLDEVPQFWNVLMGEMSLVGPRPERPFFVDKLSREIPLYHRRHRVKPGITGWAQVKWKYDENLDDVRQKVKYDLFYIENVSLRMDLKILFRTLRTTFLRTGR